MGLTRKALNWYARLSPSHGKQLPPYEHVVQIGDPTLRRVSKPIPIEKIKSKEIQNLIHKLHFLINKYESVGMAAPQLGVNMSMFAIKYTHKQLLSAPKEIKLKGLYEVPFTVFINPHMKILDYQKINHAEGCESIRGLSADVQRYKKVEITGYNADGEKISETYRDWPARIVQHEIDHLHGKLYTDIMDRKTLHCICWEEVNEARGKLAIPFIPD